jgi:hypothetical protein
MSITAELIAPINREKMICELSIKKLQEECKTFEQKYDLSTKKFIASFNSGKLGDDEHLFKWYSLYEAIKDWGKTLNSLKKIGK